MLKEKAQAAEKDYFDQGFIDMNCGKKKEIHGYFDKFIKKRYYDMDQDAINFEDFYQMSEQFFKYRGLPVLFRDILY